MGLFDTSKVTDFAVVLSQPSVDSPPTASSQSQPLQPHYRPNAYVTGEVRFAITKPMHFRSVTVKIIGREFVEIKDDDSSSRSLRNFFKIHVALLGLAKKKGDEWRGILAPGNYKFPIAFQIPSNALPSAVAWSVRSNMRVEYYVKATIECPFAFDLTKTAQFIVSRPMPISQAAMAPGAMEERDGRRTRAFVIGRGVTRATVELSRCVIIFGTDTAFGGTVILNNTHSQLPINDIKIELVQHINMNSGVRLPQSLTLVIASRLNVPAHNNANVVVPFQLAVDPITSSMSDARLGRSSWDKGLPNGGPRPSTYRGELSTNRYFLIVSASGDELSKIEVYAANCIDETNLSDPVQSETCNATTVERGAYPRFLYEAPPEFTRTLATQTALKTHPPTAPPHPPTAPLAPLIPPQTAEVGPFCGKHNLSPLAYFPLPPTSRPIGEGAKLQHEIAVAEGTVIEHTIPKKEEEEEEE